MYISDKPSKTFSFNRMELAGSFGDLGTLLPLTIGMIMLNKIQATNVLFIIGLFYLLSGLYFRVPVAVQPMKVIAAYAIAVGLTPIQITSSSLWMGICLLFLGITGLITLIRRYIPNSVVRGIQLSVGMVLFLKGVKLIINKDPNLLIGSVGPINMGIILGIFGFILTFFLLDNKKFPAAIIILILGIVAGLLLGKPLDTTNLSVNINLPKLVPYGWPLWSDLIWVLPVVILPQIPMTIGNAIISNTDLTREYYKQKAHKVNYISVTLSQSIANFISFIGGGIPMCHGAGGIAAHYRFGARTAGSNIYIGGIFILLALFFGENLVYILNLMPLSVLGVLIIFASLQLALMIQDISDRKDFFTILSMLGLTLATNLAIAFLAGIIISWAIKNDRFKI